LLLRCVHGDDDDDDAGNADAFAYNY